MQQERDSFSSRFGVVAAAAGSAIGLGNIWKFPYITGEYGGAAFLLVYLGFILAIGIPVMLSEFIIGRRGQQNPCGSFRQLAPKSAWPIVGMIGVGAALFILSFYGVVAGWSLEYVVASLTNEFQGQSPDELVTFFNGFVESPERPIVFQLIFMAVTAAIVLMGVKNGIEKYTKFLMPLLVIIIVILDIRAVTLPNASAGLEFLFKPDFSKLTADGVLNALGHAFFSLSIGMGTLITYGSYIKKEENLVTTAVNVTFADTLIAILAGVAIFPAVFAFGIEPSAGPGLVFITLPNVFMQMPGGYLFSILFFLLLFIAALTSSISILEVFVVYLSEEMKISRKKATVIGATIISILGVFCSLSMGVMKELSLFGLNFFDLLDFISANIMLPIGGMFIALFVGWKLKRKNVAKELSIVPEDATDAEVKELLLQYKKKSGFKGAALDFLMFSLKILAPIGIAFVFLHGLGFFEYLGLF